MRFVMKRYWFAIALLLFVALRFAQPVEDGDLFWHMKYGSQILERGTLRIDHSLYSWMPASNDAIYCAWTGELLFLGLWKAFGIAGIFALRYAAMLAVLGMLMLHARRSGLLDRAEAWLAITIVLLASVVATLPKPEMLSLVLWNGLVFCWFGALASRRKLPWIYALPAIMLVWVNTHGGFLLAAPFLAIGAVAGWLLFPRRDAIHLACATALCGLATVMNPYGIRYPLQLIAYTLGRGPHPDIAWNNAFQPVFGGAGNYLRLPELLVSMSLGMLVLVTLLRRPERWALAALFVAYVPLYVVYVRSTFLLPAIFGYSVLYLASFLSPDCNRLPRATKVDEHRRGGADAPVRAGHPKSGQGPASAEPGGSAAGRGTRPTNSVFYRTILATLAILFLSSRAIYRAAAHPSPGSWMGFGIGDSQPVDEAEFLSQNNFGPRIYNTYNAGGYLLWRLFPRDRVMVDARSFPYTAWFGELVEFTRTTDPARFQAFLARHPGDVALVDFQEDMTWRSFLATPGWRPAFYGPSAAVFAPADKWPGRVRASASLARLRNGDAAAKVFAFAAATGDYPTAWSVLTQMQGPLRRQMSDYALRFAENYREGHEALGAHDYARAWNAFERAFRQHPVTGQDATLLKLLKALLRVDPAGNQAAVLRTGLEHLTGGAPQ